MSEILFYDVNGAIAGTAILIVSIIVSTFGILSILDGWWMHTREGARFNTLAWNLGWLLLWSDGGIYLLLSAAILRENGSTDLWVTVFFVISCFWALRAFRSWAIGKINGGYYESH